MIKRFKWAAFLVVALIFAVLGAVAFAAVPRTVSQNEVIKSGETVLADADVATVSPAVTLTGEGGEKDPDASSGGGAPSNDAVAGDGTSGHASAGDGSSTSGRPAAGEGASTSGNNTHGSNPSTESVSGIADSGSSSQQPVPESATPAPPPQPSCTVSVDASTMGWGALLSARTATFSEGESALAVLQRECRNAGIALDSSGGYVRGIGGLYEFDGGQKSGWMFAVNGRYPNYGASSYTVNNGDSIQWRYTRDMGNDIGGGSAAG